MTKAERARIKGINGAIEYLRGCDEDNYEMYERGLRRLWQAALEYEIELNKGQLAENLNPLHWVREWVS